jgi:hypothetical protein
MQDEENQRKAREAAQKTAQAAGSGLSWIGRQASDSENQQAVKSFFGGIWGKKN